MAPLEISKTISNVSESFTGSCTIKYQFSKDGVNFNYYDGSNWVAALNSSTNANSVSEITTTLKDFISSGSLYFRAYLISDGTQDCTLESLKVE